MEHTEQLDETLCRLEKLRGGDLGVGDWHLGEGLLLLVKECGHAGTGEMEGYILNRECV